MYGTLGWPRVGRVGFVGNLSPYPIESGLQNSICLSSIKVVGSDGSSGRIEQLGLVELVGLYNNKSPDTSKSR